MKIVVKKSYVGGNYIDYIFLFFLVNSVSVKVPMNAHAPSTITHWQHSPVKNRFGYVPRIWRKITAPAIVWRVYCNVPLHIVQKVRCYGWWVRNRNGWRVMCPPPVAFYRWRFKRIRTVRRFGWPLSNWNRRIMSTRERADCWRKREVCIWFFSRSYQKVMCNFFFNYKIVFGKKNKCCFVKVFFYI